jgi:hypothetical protein
VKIYDTAALLEYFETGSEDVVRKELAKRGITPHESAGRMFVVDREMRSPQAATHPIGIDAR